MAYVKNWLHCVWSTKKRIPFLKKEIRTHILDHIKSNALEKKIYIDIINGQPDHIHCLIFLNPDQSLANVIQLIKGESSFWINRNRLTKHKFGWAVEYFAVSICESHLYRVRNYIKYQDEHHRKQSWENEYNEFIKDYGFEEFRG